MERGEFCRAEQSRKQPLTGNLPTDLPKSKSLTTSDGFIRARNAVCVGTIRFQRQFRLRLRDPLLLHPILLLPQPLLRPLPRQQHCGRG